MNEMDLRVIKTKKSLENSLLKLLNEKPLEKITVTELCKLSGITRKTFYLHYENVSKYFEEIINLLLDDLEQSMEKTRNQLHDHHQLEPQMIHLFEHVYQNKEFYQFVFSNNSAFSYYSMFLNRVKTLIKGTIESLEEFGDITDFIVSYQANAILGVIMEWHSNSFNPSINKMNQILLDILKYNDVNNVLGNE